MSGRWFRLYDELVDDPKVQRLSGETVKGLLNLWCLASRNGGKLPSIDDMVYGLRSTPAKVKRLVDDLLGAGLLDQDQDGVVVPHNWNGRQFTSDVSTSRVQRFRKRRGNVSGTVAGNGDETARETDQNRAEAETEQNRAESERKKDAVAAARGMNGHSAAAPPHSGPEKDYFDRGKALLGKDAGGLLTKLLRAKDGSVPLARAAVETASTKQDPREYLGAIIRGKDPPPSEQAHDPRL